MTKNDTYDSYAPYDWRTAVASFYTEAPQARDILIEHSRAVAELALEINAKKQLGIPEHIVETGAMLHDIGIVRTDAPGIGCHGNLPYIVHGLAGAEMLESINAPDWTVKIALRHTGVGLTPQDIESQRLPLPCDREYMPETLLEKLICYADKFYSKSGDMERKQFDAVVA